MSRACFERHRQRGIALLVVMWACTLLAIVLGGYLMMVRTQALQARHVYNQTHALYAAQGGLIRAEYSLEGQNLKQRWMADGRDYAFKFDDASVTVSARSDNGKVDLNTASPEVLQKFLLLSGADAGQAQTLSDAIVAWRSFAPQSQRSRITQMYRAAGLTYGPRFAPFTSIDELQQVLGMTDALYQRLQPELTIWSWRNSPDPSTASLLALQTLPGLDQALAQKTIQARLASDAGLGLVASGGIVHSIRSVATLDDGTQAVLVATIRVGSTGSTGQPFTVLRWQEGDIQ